MTDPKSAVDREKIAPHLLVQRRTSPIRYLDWLLYTVLIAAFLLITSPSTIHFSMSAHLELDELIDINSQNLTDTKNALIKTENLLIGYPTLTTVATGKWVEVGQPLLQRQFKDNELEKYKQKIQYLESFTIGLRDLASRIQNASSRYCAECRSHIAQLAQLYQKMEHPPYLRAELQDSYSSLLRLFRSQAPPQSDLERDPQLNLESQDLQNLNRVQQKIKSWLEETLSGTVLTTNQSGFYIQNLDSHLLLLGRNGYVVFAYDTGDLPKPVQQIQKRMQQKIGLLQAKGYHFVKIEEAKKKIYLQPKPIDELKFVLPVKAQMQTASMLLLAWHSLYSPISRSTISSIASTEETRPETETRPKDQPGKQQ